MRNISLSITAVLAALTCIISCNNKPVEDNNVYSNGAVIRTDPQKKTISLVFTAADKADGADPIISALKDAGIKGGFFFTGEFYEKFPEVVERLRSEGHYVGSHSYGHLLYCAWEDRDSLLVTKEEFIDDMNKSYEVMGKFGITMKNTNIFIPPYEYYNDQICQWAEEMGLKVFNYTPGTTTNGDYTTPDMKNYYSSQGIIDKVMSIEESEGLNGYILLIHFGTVPERTDKLYNRLPEIISTLKAKGYSFEPIDKAIGL